LASEIENGALHNSSEVDFMEKWSDLEDEYAKLPKSEDLT
jgi:hypothetical protein